MSQVNGENSHQQFNQSRVHPLKQAAQELIESVNIKRQQDIELESGKCLKFSTSTCIDIMSNVIFAFCYCYLKVPLLSSLGMTEERCGENQTSWRWGGEGGIKWEWAYA